MKKLLRYILFIIIVFLLCACERELSANQNYVYTFSALVHKDEWGIETWGAHQFIVDDKIEDVESFKECYVNYLKWSGLDIDGMYNKIYYQDPKHVKIEFLHNTYMNWTVKSQNNCI